MSNPTPVEAAVPEAGSQYFGRRAAKLLLVVIREGTCPAKRPKVAFSAAIGGESRAIGPFTTDITLIYKRVINIGSAYSTISGVYYFTFSYHAGGNNLVQLNLYKNNKLLVASFDHQSVYDNADNGGNAVFVQLQQGDQVFVRLIANTHIWGNDALSTFSGCLVVE
ncbi:Caprin-2 [Liparis tanakae]|uniref:Caprin-2 n=1 Tax=Liparis tanakae TaxID=230148 RepID=A0A4Z2H5L5_9TELE|nr:Caprin-2 [Liparis tanakae]